MTRLLLYPTESIKAIFLAIRAKPKYVLFYKYFQIDAQSMSMCLTNVSPLGMEIQQHKFSGISIEHSGLT